MTRRERRPAIIRLSYPSPDRCFDSERKWTSFRTLRFRVYLCWDNPHRLAYLSSARFALATRYALKAHKIDLSRNPERR